MILVWLGSSHMQNRFIKSLNALRDIDTAERNLVAHKDNGVSFFRKKWKKKVKKEVKSRYRLTKQTFTRILEMVMVFL